MTDDEATEVRDQLKPFLNRRIEVEGTLSRFSSVRDSKARRNVPSACLNNVEIREGDHPVIDHVWVTWATLLVNSGARAGDTVRLTAQVYRYHHTDPEDHNKTSFRYGLREPRDFQCMNRTLPLQNLSAPPAVALTVAKPEEDVDRTPPEPAHEPIVVPTFNGPVALPTPVDPRRKVFDSLWTLCEEFGTERVRRTLDAVLNLMQDREQAPCQ